jgi:hypothetical protein
MTLSSVEVNNAWSYTSTAPPHVFTSSEETTLTVIIVLVGDRNSSIGKATRYGLDDSGIESRLGQDFPHPSRPVLGPTQPPIQWVPGLSRGVKRPGRGVDHPSPSSAEVKERVELYLYSPLGVRRLF